MKDNLDGTAVAAGKRAIFSALSQNCGEAQERWKWIAVVPTAPKRTIQERQEVPAYVTQLDNDEQTRFVRQRERASVLCADGQRPQDSGSRGNKCFRINLEDAPVAQLDRASAF